jgi:hypothetical protein
MASGAAAAEEDNNEIDQRIGRETVRSFCTLRDKKEPQSKRTAAF